MGDGAKSNMNYRNGVKFEDFILDELQTNGFSVSKKYKHVEYVKTEKITGIGRSDIMLFKDDKPFIRIECKSQKIGGSADEKIFSTLWPLMEGEFKEDYYIIVLRGDWANLAPGAIPKLRERAKFVHEISGHKATIIDYDNEDFMGIINKLVI